jgi:hypothetical protein
MSNWRIDQYSRPESMAHRGEPTGRRELARSAGGRIDPQGRAAECGCSAGSGLMAARWSRPPAQDPGVRRTTWTRACPSRSWPPRRLPSCSARPSAIASSRDTARPPAGWVSESTTSSRELRRTIVAGRAAVPAQDPGVEHLPPCRRFHPHPDMTSGGDQLEALEHPHGFAHHAERQPQLVRDVLDPERTALRQVSGDHVPAEVVDQPGVLVSRCPRTDSVHQASTGDIGADWSGAVFVDGSGPSPASSTARSVKRRLTSAYESRRAGKLSRART